MCERSRFIIDRRRADYIKPLGCSLSLAVRSVHMLDRILTRFHEGPSGIGAGGLILFNTFFFKLQDKNGKQGEKY